MFSLIIAIISIALIVAVVALSGYFGGDAISDAQATAHATKLVSEERQILAAMDFFQAQEKRWPVDMNELVSAGYLRTVPQGATLQKDARNLGIEFISSAYAADIVSAAGWNMPVANTPVILTVKVPKPTCKAYNRVERGDDGILRQAFETLPAQCYGADGVYQVVVRKSTVALSGVVDPVVEGGLPSKDMPEWWDSEPTTEVKQPVDQGKKPKPEIYLSSSTVDFGPLDVGQTARSATIAVTNRGMQIAKAFSVTAPAGFSLINSSCGALLNAGSGCTFAIEFTPGLPQTYSGVLTAGGDAGNTAQLQLTGGGVTADLVLSNEALNFGNLQVAQYMKSGAITLTNRGLGSAKALSVRVPTGFQAVDNSCGTVLGASSSCSFAVQFAPAAAQGYTGAIAINGDLGNQVAVQVAGVGVAPGGQITGIAFGTLDAGIPVTKDAVLTNTGIGPLQLSAPVVAGNGFVQGPGGTCGSVLAAGASCVVKVVWTPSGELSHSGTVTVNTVEAGAKQANLSGQSRATYYVDQTITAYSNNVSHAIPAGVTSITLTGKGAAGYGDYYPKVPAVPATYVWEYQGYAETGTSKTPYSGCASLPDYAKPSGSPTRAGQIGTGCYAMMESDGLYHKSTFTYVGVVDNPGSPSEPAYWDDYYGAAGSATVGGTTYSFAGGYGHGAASAATPLTYTKALTGLAQTLKYTVPSGGSLRIQYSYTRPN